jgi:hypothetical protein
MVSCGCQLPTQQDVPCGNHDAASQPHPKTNGTTGRADSHDSDLVSLRLDELVSQLWPLWLLGRLCQTSFIKPRPFRLASHSRCPVRLASHSRAKGNIVVENSPNHHPGMHRLLWYGNQPALMDYRWLVHAPQQSVLLAMILRRRATLAARMPVDMSTHKKPVPTFQLVNQWL